MMRTMRSSESVCSCSKPPPRQSRRSPDETSKTKKKTPHQRQSASRPATIFPPSIDLIASKRPTRKGISSAPPVVGLPLITLPSHFKLLLHHCLSILAIKRPPLSKTKNLKTWPYFTNWNCSDFFLLYFATLNFKFYFHYMFTLRIVSWIFYLQCVFNNLTECIYTGSTGLAFLFISLFVTKCFFTSKV